MKYLYFLVFCWLQCNNAFSQCNYLGNQSFCIGDQETLALVNVSSILTVDQSSVPDIVNFTQPNLITIDAVNSQNEGSNRELCITYTDNSNNSQSCVVRYSVIGADKTIELPSPIEDIIIDEITSCVGQVTVGDVIMHCLNCQYEWTLDGQPALSAISFTEIQEDDGARTIFSDIQIQLDNAGVYELCLKAAPEVGNCQDQGCFTIDILDNSQSPTFDSDAYDNSSGICENQELSFQNTSDFEIFQPGLGNFIWEVFNAAGNLVGSSNDIFTYTHDFFEEGLFSVHLSYIPYAATECMFPLSIQEILVNNNSPIEITCPSVVCANDIIEYVVDSLNYTCSNFIWEIDGPGSIIGPSDSSTLTIQWNDISDYDVAYVTLVSADCDSSFCFPSIINVPIFPSSINITGPDFLCNSNLIAYSVPFIPGSQYNWMATIDTINLAVANFTSNTSYVTFPSNTFGDVIVSVEIVNEFADCILSDSISVSLSNIDGDRERCFGEVFRFAYEYDGGSYTYEITDFGGNIVATGVTGSTGEILFDPLTPGTYYLDIFDGLNSCEAPIELQSIEVASPTITGENLICPNQLYSYFISCEFSQNSNNVGALWYAYEDNVIQSSGDNCEFDVIWSSGVSNYLLKAINYRKLSNGDTCFSSPSILTPIDFNPLLSVSGPQSVCYDSQQTYDASELEGGDYSWSISPDYMGTVISGENSEEVEVQWHYSPLDTTAVLTVNYDICGQIISDNITITFNDFISTLTVNETNFDLCLESPAIVIATHEGVSQTLVDFESIVWSINGVIRTSATNSMEQFIFTEPGEYLLESTLINANGCPSESTESVLITVLGPSDFYVDISFDLDIECPIDSLDTISITFTVIDGAPNATYQWSFEGTVFPNITDTLLQLNIVGVDTCFGELEVEVIEFDGICESSELIVFEIECCDCEVPDILPSTYLFSDCDNIDVSNFTVPDKINDKISYAYVFTTPQNNFYGIGLDKEFDFDESFNLYDGVGTYFVDFVGICSDTIQCDIDCVVDCDSMMCSIDTLTRMSILLPFIQDFEYDFICDTNNSHSLILTDLTDYADEVIPSNLTYLWTTPQGTSTGQNATFAGFTPGTSINVSLNVDYPNYGDAICPPISMMIQVPDLPLATFSIDNNFNCVNQNLTFIANQDVDDTNNLLWDFMDGSFSQLHTTEKELPAVGVYDVVLTVTDNYGCTAMDTTPVNIVDTDLIGALSVEMDTMCNSMGTLIFNSLDIENVIEYNWSTMETTTTNSIDIIMSGNYSVTVTDLNGCTKEFTASAILNDAFGKPISVNNNSCGSKKLDVDVVSGFDYVIYANGNCVTSQTFDSVGTYNVIVYAFDSPANCSTDTSASCALDHIVFEVVESPPVPIVSIDSLDCLIGSVTLTADNFNSTYDVLWDGASITPVIGLPSITVFEAGTYSVTYTNLETGCKTSTSKSTDGIPDFSNLITGCYTFCEDDNIINGGELTRPFTTSRGQWEWRLNGIGINGYSGGIGTTISNLILDSSLEGEITFFYSIGGCDFESDPFCLEIEDCTVEDCMIVYPDGQGCHGAPIDCAVSDGNGLDIYFMELYFEIPQGYHYCGIDPFIVDNGELTIQQIEPWSGNKVRLVANFTIDDDSLWSSVPIDIQFTYCDDQENTVCVVYQINEVNCPQNPIECNVWYMNNKLDISYDSKIDEYVVNLTYCMTLYFYNDSSCDVTEYNLNVLHNPRGGSQDSIYSETIYNPNNDTIVQHCVTVQVLLDDYLSHGSTIDFELDTNCPNVGCFHNFYNYNGHNSSGNLKISNPTCNEITSNGDFKYDIAIPFVKDSTDNNGVLFIKGQEITLNKSSLGFYSAVTVSPFTQNSVVSLGVLGYVSSNGKKKAKRIEFTLENCFSKNRSLVETNFNVRAFPNPFSGNVSIVSNQFDNLLNCDIRIFNSVGSEVKFNSETMESSIDLNINGSPGIYIIQIEDEYGNLENLKLIKI